MDEQRFLIKGRVLASTDADLQSALAGVYDTPERPRCLCINGGVEMYVAKHRLFVVKRMPESAHHHHPTCPSYEPELAQSGLGELIGESVIERSPDSVELRVDFALARTPGKAFPRGETHASAEVKAPRHRMSLRAVLHYLFERARLNHWYPAMEGKRNQGVVHKYLMEAAVDVVVKGVKLAERLYVPEPFNESSKTAIAERRRAKLAVLHSPEDDMQFKMALIIGEFKAVELAPQGRKLWIKHMPDAPLLIDNKAWERTERVYAKVFEGREVDCERKPKAVLCALVYAKREHVYQVDTLTMMLTTDQWIPLEGIHEVQLINTLIEQRRRFVKPLRYDAPTASAFPNALLLDSGDDPLEMHVVSGFMDPKDKVAKLKALKDHDTLQASTRWVWHTDQPLPVLPASNVISRRRHAVTTLSQQPIGASHPQDAHDGARR